MPIYGYTCNSCNTYVEEMSTFKESEKPQICDCGERMVKLPGAPVFHVMGYNSKNGYARKTKDNH